MKQQACVSQETSSYTVLQLQKIASHPVTKFAPQNLNVRLIWLEIFHDWSGWKLFHFCNKTYANMVYPDIQEINNDYLFPYYSHFQPPNMARGSWFTIHNM